MSTMDPAQALEARELARHSIINETIARGDSPLQQFYENSVIFVTGASGFLGKGLVEKLFRSCKIKKMFILLRSKKQKAIHDRFREMFADPVFDFLHKEQPGFLDKIVPVSGNIQDPRLGISERDYRILTNEVDIVFHVAATINFMEPLKNAVLTNVRGTKEMLLLAKLCKNLRSFVHISTAYAHATLERTKQFLPEDFLASPIAPDDLLDMVQREDEKTLDDMTPQILSKWPNTYSFTKAVAEEVIRTMSGDLPVCIVRPAIVVCAYREPMPGWVDKTNVYGPTGFIFGCGLGIIHVMNGDHDNKLDLVPVDVVNNAVIAAAQATVTRPTQGENDIKIYTVSATKNSVGFGELIDIVSTNGRRFATIKAVWYGFGIPISNTFIYHVLCWPFHYIPGYLVDGILILLGKKTIMRKVYNKITKLNSVLSFYLKNYWNFEDSNLRQLYWNLSPTDRTIFNCSMDTIDWIRYIELWCIGCRKYILKDGLKNTEAGYRKQQRLKIAHYFIVTVFMLFIFMLIYKLITYSLSVMMHVY